ncbi:Extracellular matrix protein FRAS1, partial [Ophiophagus hannah]
MAFTIHLLSTDVEPPLFQITAPLLEVSQGGRAAIGIKLTLSDGHIAAEDLFFEVVEPPHHGALLRHGSGFPVYMATGDSFTYEEITRNALHYLHDGSSSEEDSMEISVTDGATKNVVLLKVEVTPVDINGPRLDPSCSLSITVAGKNSVIITRSHFAYIDNHSPDSEIRIQLISLPMYGSLMRTASGGQSDESSEVYNFTMEDINHQRIRYFTEVEAVLDQPVADVFYFSVFDADNNRLDSQMFTNVHESIEPSMDSFSFYISDGFSQSEISSVNITIKRLNDEPPQVKVSPVSVRENTGVVIRNSSLRLRDLDTSNDLLVFTITKAPVHGYLYRRDSPLHSLENGQALAEGSTFTYQDVLEELIVYKLNSLVAQNDEFQFSLSDGLHIETGKVEFAVASPRMDLPRLVTNKGLQLPVGSVAVITNQHLRATDPDSDDLSIKYIMKKDPTYGLLHLHKRDSLTQISAGGPAKSFTQADINNGQVEYSHEKGEPIGAFFFVFDVTDGKGNRMADLEFSINVTGDRLPLSVTVNTGITLDENSVKKITTLELSAKKQGGESSDLLYRIIKQPQLGYLEHTAWPGRRISSFQQGDLLSHSLHYIHTSEAEEHADTFTFTVSDGHEEVSQLPLVSPPKIAKSVTFSIVQPPRHGQLERTSDSHHYQQAHAFSMEDIFQNRISYSHDGSNFLEDRFTFTGHERTEEHFVQYGKFRTIAETCVLNIYISIFQIVTAVPQWFRVEILPVDDGTPRVITNLGLQWLEYMNGKPKNLITKKELLTMDPDTEDNHLIYEITTGPKYGYVEKKLQPGMMVTTFTQEDVNLGLIQYVLHEENIQRTEDGFQFLVKDSKPSIVADNIFHIQWSVISFQHMSYNISEKAGSISVAVKRTGNLKQYAIVLCRTEQGTATSGSSSQPGEQDYLEYASQVSAGNSLYSPVEDLKDSQFKEEWAKLPPSMVQFDEWEDFKTCTIVIHDDSVFEGIESFSVELSMPAYALLGNITATQVFINDIEDEPTLQFDKKVYHTRDSSSIVSAICYTISQSAQGSSMYALESGSDFKSRGMSNENRVVLGPGVTMTTCDVKLVDDSEYEEEEEFEIALTDASENARLGSITSAKVMIGGPNDASTVSLGSAAFSVSEEAGIIEIPITRHGPDLSIPTSVWCATRTSEPPSATPGFDYIPSSKKVEFHPGRTEEYCTLTILDDAQSPVIEGVETFVVYLSSPQGAELAKPFQAVVAINDTFQDVPNMKFSKDVYTVKEKDHVLHVPIIRTGDLSYESSVRCHTQSQTARVTEDFEERRNAEESRVTFLKGEKVKNCTIIINDDSAFEPEEKFRVYLSEPQGNHWSGATVGKSNMATVVISNDEDAPTIEFEEAGYQVREPPGPEGVGFLNVKYSVMKERCGEAGINQSSIQFSWEVATPTDGNGARSPFETITDNTPFTSVNHMVLDSIYFSRRFHVRCVTKAVDKVGHVGTPLRSNIVTIGTDSAICHTPVVAGTARGFQAQSFIATLKYLDVKHKEHPNRPNSLLRFFSYKPGSQAKNKVWFIKAGFLDEVTYNNIVLGPGYDRPYQFDPNVRQPKTIQFYKHLNLKSCIWTFDAYYDMTELIDVCGGSVTADFQVRDSAQSFLTVHVPLYVSYVYVTAPRGWASLEHHTEMEFSFFYDTILWRTGIQTDSVLSAKLQIIRIYIRDDGRLVIEFKTHAKFRGHFVMEHHTLPNAKSFIMTPDHLGGMEFDLQLLWSGQTFDSPYQLWRATSSYSRKDYSGEYTISLIPCTVQPTQSWVDPGDKPLPCTAHAPEKFLIPIAFQQTNRPVPVVYSLNTEFQLCNNEKEVKFILSQKSQNSKLMPMLGRGKGDWQHQHKVEAGHQWYLQVIYVIGPEMIGGSRMPRSVIHHLKRGRRDLVDHKGLPVLDDSLIYDNEGDQIKNGTNMKSLSLEQQDAVSVASLSQTGASIGSGFAAVLLFVLVLLSVCFVTRKCRKHRKKKKKKKAAKEIAEQYPLNTQVEAAKRYAETLEKNISGHYCTVKNLNLLCENEGAYKVRGAKIKQMNLEVKVHNNLHDGTEV